MKKLKVIFITFTLIIIFMSCKKDPPATSSASSSTGSGNTASNNNSGNVLNTVPVNPSSGYYQLYPIRYDGDYDYGGHIHIDGSVQLTLGSNNTKIYAVVNSNYFETYGGDTRAKIDGQLNENRILLYTAPSGKKVYSINTSITTTFYWDPSSDYHGTGNLYPNSFVYRIEMIGDTSGDDLPSEGSTDRSRFRIWFQSFNVTIGNL